MSVYLQEFDGVNQTPAVRLIARAWPELLEQEYMQDELLGSWDHQVIVAFDGEPERSIYGSEPRPAFKTAATGVPCGLITYEYLKWRKVVWLHIGYVIPECRRRGIYRKLWDRLVVLSRKLNAIEIQGGVNVKNDAMLECAKALGRQPMFITNQYVIPAIVQES